MVPTTMASSKPIAVRRFEDSGRVMLPPFTVPAASVMLWTACCRFRFLYRIGNKDDSFRLLCFENKLDGLRVKMERVCYHLHINVPLQKPEAGKARLPVVKAAHGIE